jgi:hypothetical protein
MVQSEKAHQRGEAIRTNHLNRQEEELQNRILLKKSRSQEKIMQISMLKENYAIPEIK